MNKTITDRGIIGYLRENGKTSQVLLYIGKNPNHHCFPFSPTNQIVTFKCNKTIFILVESGKA